nr:DegT/DnrJ/EryC1/StrS family aminotransferase [uncultured Carboxylicivirga sp.]
MKIPFSKISCNGNELKYVTDVLESGWLTTAEKTFEFERKIANYVGAKYACAVNSCTAALHLGLEALGVTYGDKVFVPDMTFTATAEVIRYLGADPVFLDVEYGTSLITPEILEQAILQYPDVKHLIIVHFGGQACEMTNEQKNGIIDLCQRNQIKVIEDAAHAFPSKWQGKYIGTFGDITCFSFYANKTITTGEGGMLLTDNEEIIQRAKTMRLHGINRDVWDRFTSEKPSWEYDVVAPGFKYNMPDISAAIGLAQLEVAEELRLKRQSIALLYFENLKNIDCIDLPLVKVKFEDHSWHLFTITLNHRCKVNRNECIEALSSKGIGTSVHYKPLHRMTYYQNKYQLKPCDFPVSENIWQGTLSLPIYPDMNINEVEYVCNVLKETLS